MKQVGRIAIAAVYCGYWILQNSRVASSAIRTRKSFVVVNPYTVHSICKSDAICKYDINGTLKLLLSTSYINIDLDIISYIYCIFLNFE